MSDQLKKWLLFISLSFIWGSSFILMKEGLLHLTAFQVASLRSVASGLAFLPVLFRSFKSIPFAKWHWVFFSGALGSLIPAYLFCIAETGIDSSLAGALNSLTPIFVIITGALFFQMKPSPHKILGILVAFTGCIGLYLGQGHGAADNSLVLILMVIAATLCYGLNVNLVQRFLKGIPSIEIVSIALFFNAIPALTALYCSGYFELDFSNKGVLVSSGFSALLGIGGTAIANFLFYILLKRSGPIFSSMVTYGIPFVALGWGLVYGEKAGWPQFLSLSIILTGVYIANRKVAGPKGE